MQTKFNKAIEIIDTYNAEDPNKTTFEGESIAKELLYSQRMTRKLLEVDSEASEELQLAIRAQHICRWKIERSSYPMDRIGYFKWRNDLKKMHSEIASEILHDAGYETDFIERVSFLIQKKSLKKDQESQMLEDIVCLVFLEYYLEEFMSKHTDEKVVDILQKTWKKMSTTGHNLALQTILSERASRLVKTALNGA
ncbi:protein of unknown function [Tenacibaculum sp. MAR_2009_124]|uniref:DUF4202 domain-containing protein n=1 Tax=Tenacibaculum sp. MAR_2009_124 TaxID=1250059 RepID=UPI000898F1AB|nr:DUF4202 domain-containing protein [Tenacibaculum sp. MAR_2009_124]SEC23410.1 protein of unknown function [Tenacibaculum sp. MAR_2009_124]